MSHSLLRGLVGSRTELLSTAAGSRLYGLSRPDSDWDHYVVVLEGSRARQEVVGDQDVTVVPLGAYVKMVERGVPQALEALWSPVAVRDPRWAAYFSALRPNYHEARRQHLKDHATNNVSPEKLRQRYARLALNTMSLAAHNRYNPVLSGWRLQLVQAARDSQELSDLLHQMAQIAEPGDLAPLRAARELL